MSNCIGLIVIFMATKITIVFFLFIAKRLCQNFNLLYIRFTIYMCVWCFRHFAGADLPHNDPLGSGIIHPGPRAGAAHVQPAASAVRCSRRADPCSAQSLHHQRCVHAGHHGAAGVSEPDPLAAHSPDGS